MDTSESKRHRSMHEDGGHPLPRHRHIGPYKLFVCLFVVSYALICIGLVRTPETGEMPGIGNFLLLVSLPLIPVLVWLTWSYICHDRHIYTNPGTGREYAIDEKGILVFDGGDECFNAGIDAENKVISCINDTDIPYMIPDGRCVHVHCFHLVPGMVKLAIEYPRRCDIRKSLDRAVSTAYSEGSVHANAMPSEDGFVSMHYTVRCNDDASDM